MSGGRELVSLCLYGTRWLLPWLELLPYVLYTINIPLCIGLFMLEGDFEGPDSEGKPQGHR